MKKKSLLISCIIGIFLFFSMDEVKAFECSSRDCTYVTYKYAKDGSPRSTSYQLKFIFYKTDIPMHSLDMDSCSGSLCNTSTMFDITEDVDVSGHDIPVAICGEPGAYDSKYAGVKPSNYSKYIYYTHAEVENSNCAEDDIYYNVDSYPRNNDDGNSNSGSNSCVEQAGLRCYYKNISNSNDELQYGYTKNFSGNKTYFNQYIIKGSKKILIEKTETLETCSCPDYVAYYKEDGLYYTMTTSEYESKKSDENYSFFKFSGADNISEEEVNQEGILKDIIPDDYYEYTGDRYCNNIFGPGTFGFIKTIYKVVKILIPILVIVLGMVDFLKVVFSGEDKDMKASGTRFLKRILIGIILLLLPYLLQFLMNILGFSESCISQLIE